MGIECNVSNDSCSDIDISDDNIDDNIDYDKNFKMAADSTTTKKNFKIAAHLLYKKYIRTYAELEINISSAARLKYYGLMEDEKRWINQSEISLDGLYNLFDDVILEMFKLMEHSLARFLISE